MSKSLHTPGPWFAVNAGTKREPMMEVRAARIAGNEPRHCVAIVCTGDSHQQMESANAALIAAAPELLEVVERMLSREVMVLCECGESSCASTKARAAVAKARGEI